LVVTALKTSRDYITNPLGFPHPIVLSQLTSAWSSADLGRGMLNSTLTAGIGAIVTIVLAAPAAEACARTRSRAKVVVLGLAATVWMVPLIIWIIPLFVELTRVGLTNNLVVLGVVYGVSNVPLGVFLLYTYMREAIDKEVREAAAVDGAPPRQVFLRISLPLTRPVLFVIGVLGFIWAWGDILLATVLLTSNNYWTVTMDATNFSQKIVTIQVQAAAALIAMSPLVLLFVVAQKGIVKGLVTTSHR
jgi:ABC-type glycerol-3-phosphate transport system permease component